MCKWSPIGAMIDQEQMSSTIDEVIKSDQFFQPKDRDVWPISKISKKNHSESVNSSPEVKGLEF